jgi:hypothetical protein
MPDTYTAGALPIIAPVTDNPTDGVRGAVPRDYSVQPAPMYKVDFPLIPRGEWSERIRDKKAAKSQLSDIRNRMDNGQRAKSYDQNGQGFCWMYSVTAALTLARACAGLPYVRLSAHSGACKIKSFRDEGGWCGLAMEFVQKNGVVPESHWPAKSMARANDTAANWKEAEKYVALEGWVDLDVAVYDRNMTVDQVGTLMLSNVPGAFDFNHWGHSVCWLDVVDSAALRDQVRSGDGKLVDLATFDAVMGMNDPRTAGYAFSLWNSWTDTWGDAGVGLLTGSKMIPDGAVAITTPTA